MDEKLIYPDKGGKLYKFGRKIGISVFLLLVFMIPMIAASTSDGNYDPQQAITIKGKLTDAENNSPLPGVNVVVKGTQRGIMTDINGAYSIDVPDNNAVISFSFIGYVSQDVVVGTQREINVSLTSTTKALEEVVVVGYGNTQKKATLTGAVSSIKSEGLAVTKNESVVNMLSGKLPGVRIVQKSAAPGAYNTLIDIRGMGTPLFVIDGVTRDQDYFARIDPSEVDNISVLKDGSAAIYGLRAANGVILVTTKSGVSQGGKVDIMYTGNFSTQQFLNVPHGVDALNYMTLRNESIFQNFNNNYLVRQTPYFSPDQMQPYIDGKPSYDWMSAVFNKNTPQQQHNLTINGGNDKLKYFMSLGYFSQEGSYSSGDYTSDRYNFRTTVDAEITKRLKARVNIGAILEKTTMPNGTGWSTYKAAWLMRPDAAIYANDNPLYLNGDAGLLYDGRNMVAEVGSKYVGYNISNSRRLNGTLQLTYEVPGIKGLSAKGSYDYSMSLPDYTTFHNLYYLYVYNPGTDVYTPTAKGAPASIQRRSTFNFDTDMQLGLYYSNKFGQHNVNGFVVYQEAYSNWDGFSAYRELLINSEYLFAGEDLNQKATGDNPGDRLSKSVIGSLTYDYSGKYLFDFRFRYDGSSRFPKGKQWGFFPYISAGWRISEENFMKDNLPIVSNFKIRASYGEMGDDGSAGNYPPTLGYSLTNSIGWSFNNVLNGGLQPQSIPNPNMTWYHIKSYNLGLDFGILKGKVNGSFELYKRDRTGLLATSSAVVPGTVGANLPQVNLNSDRNFGWEFSLDYRDKIGDINYWINPLISRTRTMRLNWQETVASNQFDYWKNRTSGRYNEIWWGNESQHMFTSLDEIRNYKYPMGQGSTPGDWINNDWNGDGVIDGNDSHPIATSGLPKFEYGIGAGGSWKNFDLAMNFQGAYKVYVQYGELLVEALPFGGQNTLSYFLDRWRPVDPNADYFSTATQWISGYFPVTGHDGRRSGTNLVQNSSYVRLKTLEIGYTLPKKLMSKVNVKNLRIYLSAYNLLTFTKLKNVDPERQGSAYVDFYSYPNNKTYTVGASIKF
jgi:TonB-linked SusC/RagA family outer membrane protein